MHFGQPQPPFRVVPIGLRQVVDRVDGKLVGATVQIRQGRQSLNRNSGRCRGHVERLLILGSET